MADDAATAEEDEGDIHEDQKLLPSRDGESAILDEEADLAVDEEDDASAELVEVAERDGSGGSVSPDGMRVEFEDSVQSGVCEEEAATELMIGDDAWKPEPAFQTSPRSSHVWSVPKVLKLLRDATSER